MNQDQMQPIEHPKNNRVGIVVGVILIVVIAILLISNFSKNSADSKISRSSTNSVSESKELSTISFDEISKHNSKDDCWTTINGEVFDLTKFIGIHKGGDKILAACGVDATDYFTGRHPTIGRVHSQMAVKILQGMKIGEFK